MTSPTITILIAAYNAEAFITTAIHSALAQTFPAAEVLVVDDASTDRTIEKVAELATIYPQIKIVRLPVNGGPSVARNAGIDAAQSDWIAILDADDRYVPDRLERLVANAVAEQADIVFDNFFHYDVSTDALSAPALKTSGPAEVNAATFIAASRPYQEEADYGLVKPMLRRAFLNENNLRYRADVRHGEDFLFMCSLLLAGARCTVVRQPGYLYTNRSSGFSRTIINYEAMQQQSRDLLKDPRVKVDHNLIRGLHDRIAALGRFAAVRDHQLFKQEENYSAMLYRAIVNRFYRRLLAENMLRRLSKLFRLGSQHG